MKINLERVEVFTDLSKSQCTVVDMRESIANLIYERGQGLACSVLAHKLYETKGEVEIDDKEADILRRTAEVFLTPAAYEGVTKQLDDTKSE